jgi:hypothetical protein
MGVAVGGGCHLATWRRPTSTPQADPQPLPNLTPSPTPDQPHPQTPDRRPLPPYCPPQLPPKTPPPPKPRPPQIGDHSKVDSSIVGWESKLGAWSRLEGHCVLGKDVTVKVGEGAKRPGAQPPSH